MADNRPRDVRISDIFYYFAEHTTIESGRTAGRKIGTIQEILVKKLLHTSPRLINGIVYEPRVPGKSGATHKVEFVFFQPLEAAILPPGRSFGFATVAGLSVGLEGLPVANRAKLAVAYKGESTRIRVDVDRLVPSEGPCAKLYDDGFALKTSAMGDGALCVALLDFRRPVASIESKRVGAQRFSGSDKLGSGIQTIEKAKQASLAAVDFDLNFNDTLLALSDRAAPRKYKSIVVLGNGVHWTLHDRSILRTYVDNTYLASDAAIIRYAEYVRTKALAAGKDFFPFFMAYFNGMTQTPADDFVVTEDDFPLVEPTVGPGLLALVNAQLQPFPIASEPR